MARGFSGGTRSGGTPGVKGSPIKIANRPAAKSTMPSPTAKVMATRTNSVNPSVPKASKNRPFAPATPKSSQPIGRASGSKFTANTGGPRGTEKAGPGRPGGIGGRGH